MTNAQLDELADQLYRKFRGLGYTTSGQTSELVDIAIADVIAAMAEHAEPVAWQWLDTSTFRKRLPSNAEPGAWRPLYAANCIK